MSPLDGLTGAEKAVAARAGTGVAARCEVKGLAYKGLVLVEAPRAGQDNGGGALVVEVEEPKVRGGAGEMHHAPPEVIVLHAVKHRL